MKFIISAGLSLPSGENFSKEPVIDYSNYNPDNDSQFLIKINVLV